MRRAAKLMGLDRSLEKEERRSAIELMNVDKSFETKVGRIDAVSDVTLDVREHEFVAIVGSSGCGKSTLLRIIAGLMRQTAGAVRVGGEAVDGPNAEIGMVFQTPVLLPWRTVKRNIEIQIDIRRLNRRQYADEVASLIRLVGLEGFEDRHPYELSGGMQQRVALCRALIHNPSMLLMDEPFGALDALTREQMNLELQRIWLETKKSVVLVTHSISEAVFLADRVVVMTPRPGTVQDIVPVDLPRPRSFEAMKHPKFYEASDWIRNLMNATALTD